MVIPFTVSGDLLGSFNVAGEAPKIGRRKITQC